MSRLVLLPLLFTLTAAFAQDPAAPPAAEPAEVPAVDPVAPAAPAVPETEPVAPTVECTKLTIPADKEACLGEWSRYEVAKAAWLVAHPPANPGKTKAKRSNSNRMEAEATDE